MKHNDPFREFGYYYTEAMSSRHIGLILLAIGLSFLIHLVLFQTVGDMRFSVSAPIEQKTEKRQYPTVHVESLLQDPEKPLENPRAEVHSDASVGGTKELINELSRHPDQALTLPVVPESIAAGQQVSLLPPPEMELDTGWQPRQKVAEVVERIVRDDIATRPRQTLPTVENIEMAPDYVLPSDLTKTRLGADILPVRAFVPEADPGMAAIAPNVQSAPEKQSVTLISPTNRLEEEAIERIVEQPEDISDFKPIDDRLQARMSTYRGDTSDGRVYFRLQVMAQDNKKLPVVPKDIVFVQDASRSLAEQRLYFCRKALHDAIRSIAPADRFNVVLFREKAEFCFPDWTAANETSLLKADAFIDTMKSKGDTDVFDSIKSLLSLPRDSKRPLIVVLVTDGKATKGLTVSSDIIGQFSALNDNVSLFAIGTQPKANRYLLDLLTYCNRGASWIAKDRWAIPETVAAAVNACSRPVLARIGVVADRSSKAEVYPMPSANLYADRILEYYGSCPGNTGDIVFYVRGEGGETKCDVVLQMKLDGAKKGGPYIKNEWAKRKMHSLIGEYARKPSAKLLEQMRRLNAETGVPIPYTQSFIR